MLSRWISCDYVPGQPGVFTNVIITKKFKGIKKGTAFKKGYYDPWSGILKLYDGKSTLIIQTKIDLKQVVAIYEAENATKRKEGS